MTETKKIVVGVDGSPGSLKALRWALAEARRRSDAVEVIHSWHVPNYGDVTGMVPYPGDVLEQAAAEVMAGVLAAVADDAAGVTVTSRIESAVGRDLQFIRINGTLVGGLVGIALYAIQRFF